MRKRTVKLWRLHEDGRKLFAGTIEAADPRELVLKWSPGAVATDGRMILLHRTTGQRHQKLTVFTVTSENWETALVGLYQDHLKKGPEEVGKPNTDPPRSSAVASIRAKKSQ